MAFRLAAMWRTANRLAVLSPRAIRQDGVSPRESLRAATPTALAKVLSAPVLPRQKESCRR